MLLAVAATLFMSACGSKNPIDGRWQMQQFVSNGDTMSMIDNGFVQVWDFTQSVAEGNDLDGFCSGSQYQDQVMNQMMAWKLSADSDTLYIINQSTRECDTFEVRMLNGDTLVLGTMTYNIPVLQIFQSKK